MGRYLNSSRPFAARKHCVTSVSYTHLDVYKRQIDQWLEFKASQEQACNKERRWFTHEMQVAVLASRPSIDANAIRSRLKNPAVAVRLGPAAKALEQSLAAWETDHRAAWTALNAAHTESELKDCKDCLLYTSRCV